MATMVRATRRGRPARVPRWLNARRTMLAGQLAVYLAVSEGDRVFLNPAAYQRIARGTRMRRHQVEGAIDDLSALGVLEMREAGGLCVVKLLREKLLRYV